MFLLNKKYKFSSSIIGIFNFQNCRVFISSKIGISTQQSRPVYLVMFYINKVFHLQQPQFETQRISIYMTKWYPLIVDVML